jgi:hypothetical protein
MTISHGHFRFPDRTNDPGRKILIAIRLCFGKDPHNFRKSFWKNRKIFKESKSELCLFTKVQTFNDGVNDPGMHKAVLSSCRQLQSLEKIWAKHETVTSLLWMQLKSKICYYGFKALVDFFSLP